MTSETDNRTTELQSLSKLKLAGRFHYWRGTIEIPETELHAICDEIQAEHEQAIAATLGSGTCKNVSKFEQFRCGECGASLMLETYDGDYTLEVGDVACAPAYCPNCGRQVVA